MRRDLPLPRDVRALPLQDREQRLRALQDLHVGGLGLLCARPEGLSLGRPRAGSAGRCSVRRARALQAPGAGAAPHLDDLVVFLARRHLSRAGAAARQALSARRSGGEQAAARSAARTLRCSDSLMCDSRLVSTCRRTTPGLQRKRVG